MKIFCKFPTVNISKLNFWLVICIAKNFIWTTLKAIFSIFRFFAPSDSDFNSCISAKYCPIITNHTSMESLCIQLSDDVYISISINWPLWLVLWSRVTFVMLQKWLHMCTSYMCLFFPCWLFQVYTTHFKPIDISLGSTSIGSAEMFSKM